MAEKFRIIGVRFRYIAALGITALFCVLFVFFSDISNRQFKAASHVATLIANFDVTVSEAHQLIGIIASEGTDSPVSDSHLLSLNDKIAMARAAITDMRASWHDMPERLKNELDLSGFSADQQWDYLDRIVMFTDQEDWEASGAANLKDGYSFFYGRQITFAMAALQNYFTVISDRSDRVNKLFGIISVAMLILLGLLIFRPMEKAIAQSFSAVERERQRAELADRAKSEFLANMSHEIRTPMNGVMGMAELLAKTELDTKQKMFTDIIVRSGHALVTIINDILDFSKIDSGQLELDLQPFRLAEAVEDVTTLVSTKVQEKELELAVRIQPDLPEMYIGDIGRIRQIITNLVSNAVKFTEQGHVLVDVSGAVASDDDGGDLKAELLVKVEDTGIGIPAEKLDHVFEKFSQVDGSSTRTHEGTGLGLTIAKQLVEIMGGEIGADSEPGRGSTFWFTLPLPVHDVGQKRRRVPVDVSGARILVIDDNEVNRSILMEQLGAWKFDATATPSGREGLAVLGHAAQIGRPVSLVILDYHMPGMDGANVADLIRADAAIRDTPVIMLTSVDDNRNSRRLRDLVIQAHLVKPARASLLLDTMITVLQDAHDANAGAAEDEETDIGAADTAGGGVAAGPAAPVPIGTQAGKGDGKVIVRQGRSGLMILVAEDNEVNQIVVEQILIDAGHSYAIVENGKLALEQFRAERPDLVLMDVSMPDMNGLEATKAMREVELDAGDGVRTPIIGLTAHALKGDKEICMEAGMDDYMPKPISPDALQAKIAEWLEKSGKAGETQGVSASA
jgi:signal transduction histidine kinase/CheY-like chemotaxis protein